MSVDVFRNANFSEHIISVLSTYDSTSPSSGSLLTSGGLGVKLSAHIGEQLSVNSVNITPSLGDIVHEREEVLVNNSFGTIENMVFYNDITQSFKAIISTEVSDISQPELNKRAMWEINGNLGKDGWRINKRFTGDITNILFTIENTVINSKNVGQFRYYNPQTTGITVIRYKVNTVSPSGASNDAGSYGTTPVEFNSNTLVYTAVNTDNWTNVPSTTQEALDELALSLNSLKFINEYHVSKSGDENGNGSIRSPFLTISAAIEVAEAVSIGTSVIIYIHPGVYTENISITKPKISLVGMTNTLSNACQINGNITVTPSDDSEGVFNTIFTFENLLITGRSGSSSVLTFSGNKTGYIHINNCKLWSSETSQRIIYVTNTSGTVPRIKIKFTDLQNTGGTGSIFEVQSGATINGGVYNSFFYGNSSNTIVCRGSASSLVMDSCDIQGANTYLVDVIAGLMSFLKCSFLNSSLNSSGINMSSSAIVVTYNCLFSIPTNTSYPSSPPATTTGYAVKGVSGSNFTYGGVTFVPLANINGTYYWTTNKISSVITILPSATTFVSQA
jgi:hypothetical protein